jgi:DNA-binding transcriptional regulator YhcF (GntR family)
MTDAEKFRDLKADGYIKSDGKKVIYVDADENYDQEED